MKRIWIIAMAGALCSCSGDNTGKEYTRSVYVTSPETTDSSLEQSFSGIVEETHGISLGFKTAGQLSRIHAKEGDYVKKGQLLAELDDADYRLGVEALQIQYDQLTDEVARASRLYEKKSMSANDFEKASAGLRQLGVQLQVNKNKLAYTKLYAPADGYVSAVNFSPAEMVDAGTAVFNLLDVSRMEVVADIPASVYLKRNDFGAFTCHSNHIINGRFPMELLSIVPKADSNQLYRIRLEFKDNVAKHITPGMNVEICISFNTDSVAPLCLPLSALFRHDGNDCVYVLAEDSTITCRPVTIDRNASAAQAVVTSGLSAEDRVVKAGAGMLHNGEKVRVIEQPSETNVGGLL